MSSEDRDHISQGEIRKDAVQDAVEAGIAAVGAVGSVITAAVRDIARIAGDLGTELFEIRDASRKARAEHDLPSDEPPADA
jgi:hypothetical protein